MTKAIVFVLMLFGVRLSSAETTTEELLLTRPPKEECDWSLVNTQPMKVQFAISAATDVLFGEECGAYFNEAGQESLSELICGAFDEVENGKQPAKSSLRSVSSDSTECICSFSAKFRQFIKTADRKCSNAAELAPSFGCRGTNKKSKNVKGDPENEVEQEDASSTFSYSFV
jgi:hypothetical protein